VPVVSVQARQRRKLSKQGKQGPYGAQLADGWSHIWAFLPSSGKIFHPYQHYTVSMTTT